MTTPRFELKSQRQKNLSRLPNEPPGRPAYIPVNSRRTSIKYYSAVCEVRTAALPYARVSRLFRTPRQRVEPKFFHLVQTTAKWGAIAKTSETCSTGRPKRYVPYLYIESRAIYPAVSSLSSFPISVVVLCDLRTVLYIGSIVPVCGRILLLSRKVFVFELIYRPCMHVWPHI